MAEDLKNGAVAAVPADDHQRGEAAVGWLLPSEPERVADVHPIPAAPRLTVRHCWGHGRDPPRLLSHQDEQQREDAEGFFKSH